MQKKTRAVLKSWFVFLVEPKSGCLPLKSDQSEFYFLKNCTNTYSYGNIKSWPGTEACAEDVLASLSYITIKMGISLSY